MNQKHVNIILFVCIVVLSVMCYQQSKKISALEWDIASLEDDVNTLEKKVNDLESETEEIKPAIEELQEEMEEHFPRPQKTYAQQRQEYIEKINHFNAAREEEQKLGIRNTDRKVKFERDWLKFVKERYNIDIELK